jgi:hypothetical protein
MDFARRVRLGSLKCGIQKKTAWTQGGQSASLSSSFWLITVLCTDFSPATIPRRACTCHCGYPLSILSFISHFVSEPVLKLCRCLPAARLRLQHRHQTIETSPQSAGSTGTGVLRHGTGARHPELNPNLILNVRIRPERSWVVHVGKCECTEWRARPRPCGVCWLRGLCGLFGTASYINATHLTQSRTRTSGS